MEQEEGSVPTVFISESTCREQNEAGKQFSDPAYLLRPGRAKVKYSPLITLLISRDSEAILRICPGLLFTCFH